MTSFNIGFAIFPNLTQLDFTSPLQVLHRMPGAKVHIAAPNLETVPSDCGLGLVPTCTFQTCAQLDLICVPGGAGVAQALSDETLIEFLKRQASRAQFISSICTGAFLLGAAGLLQGRRATTHWAYTDLLPLVGASYEKGRVVRDGNLFTSGGVTSGIDCGLRIVAGVAGEAAARSIQLGIEYNPEPPFISGHPDVAAPELVAMIRPRYDRSRASVRDALQGRQ
jgi:cyclohexyl-isocyanide hydratase